MEVIQELGGGLMAVRRVFGKGLEDDAFGHLGDWQVRAFISRAGWRFVKVLLCDPLYGGIGKRRLAGQHLEEEDTERIDVGARIDLLMAKLFRGHVLWRTKCDLRVVGQLRELGNAEVNQFDEVEAAIVSIFVFSAGNKLRAMTTGRCTHQLMYNVDIVRLDVAMHDVALVHCRDGLGHL